MLLIANVLCNRIKPNTTGNIENVPMDSTDTKMANLDTKREVRKIRRAEHGLKVAKEKRNGCVFSSVSGTKQAMASESKHRAKLSKVNA
jgi:hypothetical protein